PTLAVYRAPTLMNVGNTHHKVLLSYAFLVDPASGSLHVSVWDQDAEKSDPPLPSRMVVLRPDLVFECPIHVKARRLLGAVPVSWSFATQALPPGQVRSVGPTLARLLTAIPGRKANPQALEEALRSTLLSPTITRSTLTGPG